MPIAGVVTARVFVVAPAAMVAVATAMTLTPPALALALIFVFTNFIIFVMLARSPALLFMFMDFIFVMFARSPAHTVFLEFRGEPLACLSRSLDI
jgi:hypothetical protein